MPGLFLPPTSFSLCHVDGCQKSLLVALDKALVQQVQEQYGERKAGPANSQGGKVLRLRGLNAKNKSTWMTFLFHGEKQGGLGYSCKRGQIPWLVGALLGLPTILKFGLPTILAIL